MKALHVQFAKYVFSAFCDEIKIGMTSEFECKRYEAWFDVSAKLGLPSSLFSDCFFCCVSCVSCVNPVYSIFGGIGGMYSKYMYRNEIVILSEKFVDFLIFMI